MLVTLIGITAPALLVKTRLSRSPELLSPSPPQASLIPELVVMSKLAPQRWMAPLSDSPLSNISELLFLQLLIPAQPKCGVVLHPPLQLKLVRSGLELVLTYYRYAGRTLRRPTPFYRRPSARLLPLCYLRLRLAPNDAEKIGLLTMECLVTREVKFP